MAYCHRCRRGFREPADEQGEHACPRCGRPEVDEEDEPRVVLRGYICPTCSRKWGPVVMTEAKIVALQCNYCRHSLPVPLPPPRESCR